MNYLDKEQYVEVFGMLHKEKELLDFAEHYRRSSRENEQQAPGR